MRKDNWFPGALPSVLLLVGLAVFASPLTAQIADPSGNTTCDDNANCASNGNTVNAGNNGSGGTSGAGNPVGPGSGSGYGGTGMGAPEGGYGPSASERAEMIRRALVEQYKSLPCAALRQGFESGDLDVLTAALIAGGILSGQPKATAAGGLIWAAARFGRGICKQIGRW